MREILMKVLGALLLMGAAGLAWIFDHPVLAMFCACSAANVISTHVATRPKCDCWETVNGLIRTGPLPGNGWDKTAERNGIVMAANVLAEKKH